MTEIVFWDFDKQEYVPASELTPFEDRTPESLAAEEASREFMRSVFARNKPLKPSKKTNKFSSDGRGFGVKK